MDFDIEIIAFVLIFIRVIGLYLITGSVVLFYGVSRSAINHTPSERNFTILNPPCFFLLKIYFILFYHVHYESLIQNTTPTRQH